MHERGHHLHVTTAVDMLWLTATMQGLPARAQQGILTLALLSILRALLDALLVTACVRSLYCLHAGVGCLCMLFLLQCYKVFTAVPLLLYCLCTAG
jgi:hypothetical protein